DDGVPSPGATSDNRQPAEEVVKGSIRIHTGKGTPIILPPGRKGVENLAEAVRARVRGASLACLRHHRQGGTQEYYQRHDENGERRHLHLTGLDLLAQVLA